MDLVQWLVPGLPTPTHVDVCLAPAWADRLPSGAGRPGLRRRSAPLVSRHLHRPLAVAAVAGGSGLDDAAEEERTCLPGGPGAVILRLRLAADGSPLVRPDDSPLHFSAVLGEFIGVVADLCEAASLPVMGLRPADEQRTLEVVLGSLRDLPRVRCADALLLVSAATELAAFSRGFRTEASLWWEGLKGGAVAIDGALEQAL